MRSGLLFLFKFLFIYLLLPVLGLPRYTGFCLIAESCSSLQCMGFSLQWFLFAEHRLWGARELSSCSSRALLPRVMWNLTGAGIEPVSPALAGGFSLSMYNLFIFNWRIFPLHCCVGFYYISTWISHRCTYVPSLLNLQCTPLGCHRKPGWAPCIIQRIPTGYLFYIL